MGWIVKRIRSFFSAADALRVKAESSAITMPDYLLACFLNIYVLTRILPMPSMLANLLAAIPGLACCVYVIWQRRRLPVLECMLFGILCCGSLVASVLHNGNGSFLYVMWVWCFLGVAMLLYSCKLNPKFVVGQFYVFCLMLGIHAVSGRSVKEFLTIGSENNISTYLILYLLVHILTRRDSLAPIGLLPILTAILLTAWTGSRGGLLALGVLFLLALLFNRFYSDARERYIALWKKLIGSKRLMLLAIVAVLAAAVVVLTSDFFARIIEKMVHYGGKSVRTQIWQDYFYACFASIADAILGPNTTSPDYQWLSTYHGNPHNAFLTLHAHFGVIPFAIVVVMLLTALVLSCKHKKYTIAIVILTAGARSFFDWTAFPGPYDVLFFYMVIYGFDRRSARRRGKTAASRSADPNLHMADLACFARYCYSWCCTRLCLLPVKKRGKDIWLQSPCRFASHTEIGDGCRFGGIEIAGSGNCTIGSHVHCGKQVTVLTDAPDYDGGRKLPCGEENIPGDVVIGDNVWIGQGVTVLAGVTIGEGAVIQAGSTVCDDIAPLAVAAGYPAKAYYSRNAEHYYALKEKQSR